MAENMLSVGTNTHTPTRPRPHDSLRAVSCKGTHPSRTSPLPASPPGPEAAFSITAATTHPASMMLPYRNSPLRRRGGVGGGEREREWERERATAGRERREREMEERWVVRMERRMYKKRSVKRKLWTSPTQRG